MGVLGEATVECGVSWSQYSHRLRDEIGGEGGWGVAEEPLLPRVALGGLAVAVSLLEEIAFAAALLEAVVAAVYLQDVDVVSKTVK